MIGGACNPSAPQSRPVAPWDAHNHLVSGDCQTPGSFDYVLIQKIPGESEYRVNRLAAPEAYAAYESDLDSAKGTACAQAAWWQAATGRRFAVKHRREIIFVTLTES